MNNTQKIVIIIYVHNELWYFVNITDLNDGD